MKNSLQDVLVTLLPSLLLMSCVTSSSINVTPTSVAVITATPSQIHESLTKHLTINCTFTPGTEISSIVSIIVAKSDNLGGQMTDIAQLTSAAPSVTPTSYINGQISGHLVSNGTSFIAFEWAYPQKSVAGRYQCTVYGTDIHGHPKVSVDTTDINEQVIDVNFLLTKLIELEKSQTAQNVVIQQQGQIIGDQKLQLNDLYSRLNSSRAALTADSASYKGHTYYLTQRLWRNQANDDSICRTMGGYLLVLDDVNEFNFVKHFLNHTPHVPGSVLTGVTEDGHQGRWTAVHSGQTVDYLNWGYHQPDKTAGYTCVYLAKSESWKMSDGPCRNDDWEQFVCEVPA